MIRSYGPGKFVKLIDSYAYELTLDGGPDEEASYGEGNGWYGLLWLDPETRDAVAKVAVDHDDEITPEEEDLLDDSKAVIFFERSDGIVEADWFDDKKEAEEAWAEILVDTEGEEEEEEEFDDG
jgi:hypothetical protein